jgi:hypothetical protein
MRLRDDLKAGLDAETGSWDGRVVFADPPESELSETTTREWTLPDQSVLRQREAAVREVIGPTPTAGNDLYEAYLFGLVLVAASREGFNAVLADADGPATVLRLRRAPGRLPSGGLPGARFTHAVLECPPRPALELHTGVGVVGQSKVVHEADVLVLPQADADRCRSLDLDPRGRDAELLIEAKYYTNPVGLGTGREFLGLRSDISAKHKVFVATLVGDSVLSLFSGKSVPHDICVFPVGVGRRVYLA